MSLATTIFRFEFRQLLRQPSQLIMLAFYIIISIYSLYAGHAVISRQAAGLDSLHKNKAALQQELHKRFHEDTSTRAGKNLAANAGVPQVVEFRNPPYATHPPHRLSMLAIGQRDLLPSYDLVSSKHEIVTPPNAEFINAEKLAAGNFDLSFVIIYLFPLLVMAWSHNCLSKEMESRTDKLLAIQGASMRKIVYYKLLFRFIVIALIIFLLSVPGFVLTIPYSRMSITDVLLWLYLALIYLLFWFALCWLIIGFRQSSHWNILCTLGLWLLFVIVIPAAMNSSATLIAPPPLHSELASAQRVCKEETWEMPVPALIDSFYQRHPEYHHLRQTGDTAEFGNRRFIAYTDLLGARLNRIMQAHDKSMQRYNKILLRGLYFNPVTQLQHLLYANAESGLANYNDYTMQVNIFREKWIRFMNNYLLFDRRFKEEELDSLPRFSFSGDDAKTRKILIGSISVWLMIIIIIATGKLTHPGY
ncbi:MAG TPA: DUF3526 domain-containing protein [Chitinophaga sp.]|uniref:DUF3526 domain-containing protein n=1 Tax=Chitinophaga sp. TaxID=1869181 RepID=UPI002BAD3835|nr:DUF3526 domain-containing protein [Chitinophaga sp.]HVI48741.1 DUF3526 domain-containing protein [Chitinophaga sp.]